MKELFNVTLQLDAYNIKREEIGKNVAYAHFKNELARFKALTILNGYKWQGTLLRAEVSIIYLMFKDIDTKSLMKPCFY